MPIHSRRQAHSAVVVSLSILVASAAWTATPAAADTASPYEIAQFTTENTTVLQLPDGRRKLITNRAPVRAKRDGTWSAIDTNVSLTDGKVSPANTTADVTFSDGGTDPLVTIADNSQTFTLTWPTALPTPTLNGNRATYTSVRPDVDLVLSATADGYSQVLVVHTPAAAHDLAANPIKLNSTTTGGKLTQAPDDSISATSTDGTSKLDGHTPVMWDSSRGATDEIPTAADSAQSPQEPVALEMSATSATTATITIQPDTTQTADTVYPLFIDPGMSASRLHYSTVHSLGWNYFDDSTQPLRVGKCGWAECNTSTQGVARSYFSFNLGPATSGGADPLPSDATIYSAAVFVNQIHSSSSTPTPVSLSQAGGFNSSTAWPGPLYSSLQQITDIAGFNTNPAKVLTFNNTSVVSYVTAHKADNVLNFALNAPDETNAYQWKKFANNPQLEITFNTPPATPTDLTITATQGTVVSCPGKPLYVTDNTPNLLASSTNSSTNNIGMWFELWNSNASSRLRYNTTAPQGGDNVTLAYTTNGTASNDGTPMPDGAYKARARAESVSSDTYGVLSNWSAWKDFTIDTTAPTTPTISSFTYPANAWGAAQNSPGTFTLSSPNATAFSYAWDTGTPPTPTQTTCNYSTAGYIPATNGIATLTAPTTLQPRKATTLTVKAFDDAHNTSSIATYTFYVSPVINGNTNPKNLYEAENLTISPYPATTTAPTGTQYDETGTPWSGGKQSHLSGKGHYNYTFTAPVSGYYAIGLQVTEAPHYGKLRFLLNEDNPTGITVPTTPTETSASTFLRNPNTDTIWVLDTYRASNNYDRYTQLGGYHLNAGPNTITVSMLDTSAPAGSIDNGYTAGIDFFTIAPLKLDPATSQQAAFNNNGIGGDTATPNFDGNGQSIKADTFNPPLTPTTIPAPGTETNPTPTPTTSNVFSYNNTPGLDNTIAYGQDITLNLAPTPGKFRYLDLLIGSCSTINPTPNRQFTITYSKDTDTQAPTNDFTIPLIPTWNTNPTNLPTTAPTPTPSYNDDQPQPATLVAARQAPTRYNATTTITNTTTLYHLRIPLHPDYSNRTITTITLPNIGTLDTPQPGCQNGLHILNITATTITPQP